MENVVCDELKREMQECITNNDGIHQCKELIENFEKICKKEEEVVEETEEEIEEKKNKATIQDEITKLLLE